MIKIYADKRLFKISSNVNVHIKQCWLMVDKMSSCKKGGSTGCRRRGGMHL
jgi:hypothetical protein